MRRVSSCLAQRFLIAGVLIALTSHLVVAGQRARALTATTAAPAQANPKTDYVPPPVKPASSGPIGFEEMTTTAPVTDQYSSRGVTFNGAVAIDYSNTLPGFARGTRALEACYGGESGICKEPIRAIFSSPQSRVKVWVGYSGSHPSGTITLIAADAGAVVIDQREIAISNSEQSLPISQQLEVADPAGRIASVEVRAAGGLDPKGLAIDDMEFESAITPPPAEPVPPAPLPAPVTLDFALGSVRAGSEEPMVLYVPVSVTGARSVETVLVVSSSWGSVRFDVSPLEPGDHVIPVTLPRRLAPGRYDTVVEINRPATQPETNDDNNVATLTVTVAPPGLWLIFAIAAGVALLAGGTWLVRRPAPEAAGAPAIPEIQFRPAPGASRSVISRRTPGTSDPFVVAVRPRLGNSGR